MGPGCTTWSERTSPPYGIYARCVPSCAQACNIVLCVCVDAAMYIPDRHSFPPLVEEASPAKFDEWQQPTRPKPTFWTATLWQFLPPPTPHPQLAVLHTCHGHCTGPALQVPSRHTWAMENNIVWVGLPPPPTPRPQNPQPPPTFSRRLGGWGWICPCESGRVEFFEVVHVKSAQKKEQ